MQFSAVCASVVEWLNSAEAVIEEEYDGVDYEIVSQKLSLHKVCFRLHFMTCAHVHQIVDLFSNFSCIFVHFAGESISWLPSER